MYELSTLIIVGIFALIAGGIAGVLIYRGLHPEQQQNRELENRVQRTEQQMKEYQQEVSEHFAETSQLVNKLTQSYKDVHEHLASSALKLTNPDISRQLIDAGEGKLLESTTAHAPVQPKDWAPKSPGEMGQLSEGFGIDKSAPGDPNEALDWAPKEDDAVGQLSEMYGIKTGDDDPKKVAS